jgi:hypothetical protein
MCREFLIYLFALLGSTEGSERAEDRLHPYGCRLITPRDRWSVRLRQHPRRRFELVIEGPSSPGKVTQYAGCRLLFSVDHDRRLDPRSSSHHGH